MKPLTILVSLITEENDFQMEQAAAAQATALRLGVQLQIVYAANDAVNQSQQLFSAIQSSGQRPDGILVEPVGTGMAQAAGAAVTAGIGWGVGKSWERFHHEFRWADYVIVALLAAGATWLVLRARSTRLARRADPPR